MSIDHDDIQDEYTQYVDKPDDAETATAVPGGSSPSRYALPDETPRAELIQQVVTAIGQALTSERFRWAEAQKSAVRVTTNLSGQVLFGRFSANTQVIQICREKDLRGDITIVNFDAANPVYVGLHAGIIIGGTDTCRINAGSARTIRTRNALWAIASAAVEIDVQEEFD